MLDLGLRRLRRGRYGVAGRYRRRCHFDIRRLARIVKPGHRVHGDRTRETRGAGYEYLHIAIDDHGRLAFTAILPDQKHTSAILFCHMARAHFYELNSREL